MVRFRAALGLALLLLGALASAAPQPTATVVVENGDSAGETLGGLLESQLKGRVLVRRVTYDEVDLEDPIAKGKLLASVQHASLVVALGEDPTQLVLSEVEDLPVYFVSPVASGAGLAPGRVGGLLAYSAEDVVAALPPEWKKGFGLLYTPGYEPVLALIRSAATAGGVTLVAKKVSRKQEIPEAMRGLSGSARAIWVLGDPMVEQGAGFEFLAEQSLSRNVPLVGSSPSDVRRGAVFACAPKPEALADRASREIADLLSAPDKRPALSLAPRGGGMVFSRALQARFGLNAGGERWSEAR